MSPSQSDALQHYETQLYQLKKLIHEMPVGVPRGLPDNPIAVNFRTEPTDIDDDTGPYGAFNRAWERTFQKPTQEGAAALSQLIVKGPYGLGNIVDFTEKITALPAIRKDGSIFLVGERLLTLNQLLKAEFSKYPPPPPGGLFDLYGGTKPKLSHGQVSEKPALKAAGAMITLVDSSDSEGANENVQAGKKRVSKGKSTRKPKRKKTPLSGSSGDEAASNPATPIKRRRGRGRQATKGKWALGHYTPTPANDRNGAPTWHWQCNHCPTFRTSVRTKGCKLYSSEILEPPPSSNFISHLGECKHLPVSDRYENWIARQEGREEPEAGGNGGAQKASRDVMGDFVQRGIANPEKTLTQKGFRELFAKAIFQEDLPFSFGEKAGIRKLFEYILPARITIPTDYMVRADLDRLHEVLSDALTAQISENKSQVAIASDLWTSKNSVYAFAGIVVFWINGNWELNEYVLDLIPLDGDHSGAACGKEVFASLERHHITEKLSANTADNASSNGVMNRAISKRAAKVSSSVTKTSPEQLQIGCAAHVVNLICQDILHGIGAAPSTDEIDLYETSRGFPLVYKPDNEPEAVEELKQSKTTSKRSSKSKEKRDERPEDVIGTDDEEDWEDTEEPESGATATPAKTKKGKVQNVVQRIHSIVVFILRSEVRRSRMRKLIRQLCDLVHQHLTLIKSMPVRWNTTYAEIERGILLSPAINQFIEQLDRQLTGKKREAALKMKKAYYLSPSDWDTLRQIAAILSKFNDTTLELSKSEPTLCKILPTYKLIENHLNHHVNELSAQGDPANITKGVEAGLLKLSTYAKKALKSDNTLLATVLHPSMRAKWLKKNYGEEHESRAKALLRKRYETYRTKSASGTGTPTNPSSAPTRPPAPSSCLDSVMLDGSESESEADSVLDQELELYYRGTNPFVAGTPVLQWWKNNQQVFPILALIARDILAIPGVSVSVERLFSSCKHTISDTRSSISADAASKAILVKDWLKRGLGDGVNYLENVHYSVPAEVRIAFDPYSVATFKVREIPPASESHGIRSPKGILHLWARCDLSFISPSKDGLEFAQHPLSKMDGNWVASIYIQYDPNSQQSTVLVTDLPSIYATLRRDCLQACQDSDNNVSDPFMIMISYLRCLITLVQGSCGNWRGDLNKLEAGIDREDIDAGHSKLFVTVSWTRRSHQSTLRALKHLQQNVSLMQEAHRRLAPIFEWQSTAGIVGSTLEELEHDIGALAQKVSYFESVVAGYSEILLGLSQLRNATRMRFMAEDNRRDSEIMKTITVVTLIYLPATFVCTLLSMGVFQWPSEEGDGLKIAKVGWIFLAIAIPLSVITCGLAFAWLWYTRKPSISRKVGDEEFGRKVGNEPERFNFRTLFARVIKHPSTKTE